MQFSRWWFNTSTASSFNSIHVDGNFTCQHSSIDSSHNIANAQQTQRPLLFCPLKTGSGLLWLSNYNGFELISLYSRKHNIIICRNRSQFNDTAAVVALSAETIKFKLPNRLTQATGFRASHPKEGEMDGWLANNPQNTFTRERAKQGHTEKVCDRPEQRRI